MNPIGSTPQPVITIQTTPVVTQAPASNASNTQIPQVQAQDADQTVDLQAAEQRRFAAVQRASQDIANIYVVGDKRITIFKDLSGQYITRFTSLRDGMVTYIPEPQLFKIQSSAQDTTPIVKLSV